MPPPHFPTAVTRHVIALLSGLLLSLPVRAELSSEFRALTLNMPPFSVSVDPERKEMPGYFGEIFIGAMRQANLLGKIEVDMIPWRRAQQYALQEPNVVLFPLIRTAEREPQYRWLALILREPCYAWTIDPNLSIESLEQVRHAGLIGGLAGGPQTREVRRILGADAYLVEDSESEIIALRRLLAGRIKVWSAHSVTAHYVAREYSRNNKLPEIKLRRGHKFFDADIWMAVSKQTLETDAQQLQQALETFFLSREYQAINRKYHIVDRQYVLPE